MIEALALLALTIGVLFSGLVIGALRQEMPATLDNSARTGNRKTRR